LPSYDRIVAQITARAWSDEQFKLRLLREPAAVMREYGIDVPMDINVYMHENTAANRHVVLPRIPPDFDPNKPPSVALGYPSVFRLDPGPLRPPRPRGGRKGGAKQGGGRKGGSRKRTAKKGGKKRSR
jgi:hypothetical protein